jgi:hypothetical protein
MEALKMLMTGGSSDKGKKTSKSWTWLISQAAENKDTIPLLEKRFEEVKKHDVIDVGHRMKEIKEIQEPQLEEERSTKKQEEVDSPTTEAQLDKVREDDEYVIVEARLSDEGKHNPSAWEGDDIKIFREVNRIQKQNAEANDEFYKENKDRTKGGTVSASKKKI